MALHLHSVTLDADDPVRLAGDGSVGPGLMFIKVPEAKSAKNRMHNEFCIGLHP